MAAERTGFGMLLQPSARSAAYVSAMRGLGVAPSWVALMADAYPARPALTREAKRHGYARLYFDPDPDFRAWLEDCGATVVETAARSVNDPALAEALAGCPCATVLYTGGGIASRATLGLGPRLLHIHPGLTPRYRGSTCFYYSLLAENALGATAFLMEPELDRGPVAAAGRFTLNYRVGSDQPLFMDHVLDPALRGRMLARVLPELARSGGVAAAPVPAPDRPPYFVMHPALRSLAVRRLNARHDPSAPEGLRELPSTP